MAVTFDGDNPPFHIASLNLAFAVSDAELRIGYVCDPGGGSYCSLWSIFLGFNVQSDFGAIAASRPPTEIGDLDDLHDILSHFDPKLLPTFVPNSLNLFCSLDRLPDHEPIKVLGYFTVLESLLSHAPADNDRADSIRRQLERNLILLDNRLKRIDQSMGFEEFGNIGPRKLIGKLYSYRSDIG